MLRDLAHLILDGVFCMIAVVAGGIVRLTEWILDKEV